MRKTVIYDAVRLSTAFSSFLVSRLLNTSIPLSADGERFVTVAPVEDNDEEVVPLSVRVVQNWYEEFRDREQ